MNVLTIDYASTTIYWIDHCLYQIQSLRLDGDATSHSYPFTTFIFFASGLVIKNDTFYWSDQDGVFERKNLTNAIVNTIYDVPRGSRATGLQLVHSTVQPQGNAHTFHPITRRMHNIFGERELVQLTLI